VARNTTDIRSLARSHTATGIRVLAKIASCKDSADAARVSAIRELFDRGYGKPFQEGKMTHEAGDGVKEMLEWANGRSLGLPKKTLD